MWAGISNSAVRAIELRKKYPCWTLQRIASEVDLSRERVRQLLVRAHLATKAIKPFLRCRYCGVRVTHRNGFRKGSSDLCSKCYKEYELYTMLECEECKGLFFRRTALVVFTLGRRNYRHVWCSKQCQGSWVGRRPRRFRKYEIVAV